MATTFQDYLAQAYGRGNIHQLPQHARRICLNNYGPNDVQELFCHIHVHVKDDANNSFDLHLEYAPTNDAVLQLVEEVRGKITDNGLWKDIRLHLNSTDGPYIRRLAQAIKRVVAPGAKYQNRNWRWIAPRTAASLEKLAAHLKQYERMRKAGTLPTYAPAAPPPTATVVPTGNGKAGTKSKPAVVQPQIDEDDDEENLYKICGVE